MADRVARKDMGKRFRLSTEVRATLQRKHDSWTPYRAYSRVEKELSVFRALCKMIISFFQMPATENDEVGCNGRAVKMFADLIKRSLRDEDFVARKCMTFNVVLFFYYRICFLLMVRFVVNVYLFIFFPFFCYRRLYVGYWVVFGRRDETVGVGAIVQGSEEENQLAVKVCLELVTMCCTMTNVRVGATDSALEYLLNNTTNNDFKTNLNFKRNSTFITTSDDDGSTAADGESTETAGKCCKVMTTVVNEGAGKVDKSIDVDVVVPDEYELHDFLITDEGIISFGGGIKV